MKRYKLKYIDFYHSLKNEFGVICKMCFEDTFYILQIELNDFRSSDMIESICGLLGIQLDGDFTIRFYPCKREYKCLCEHHTLTLPFTSTYVDKSSQMYILCRSYQY